MAIPVISKFITPGTVTNLKAATFWGVAAGTAALYLVQPFDYIRKTFFEKPAPEA